jgi:hypothetical protein
VYNHLQCLSSDWSFKQSTWILWGSERKVFGFIGKRRMQTEWQPIHAKPEFRCVGAGPLKGNHWGSVFKVDAWIGVPSYMK